MIKGPQGLLVVRDDGLSAIKLEDKGRELHKRLSAGRILDAERQRVLRRRYVACRPCAVAAGGKPGRGRAPDHLAGYVAAGGVTFYPTALVPS
ncbi:MAG TPA: hypothetical protein VIY28_13870 [Pseudonocardiaceae bacterium]